MSMWFLQVNTDSLTEEEGKTPSPWTWKSRSCRYTWLIRSPRLWNSFVGTGIHNGPVAQKCRSFRSCQMFHTKSYKRVYQVFKCAGVSNPPPTTTEKKNVVLCTKSRAQMCSLFQNLHPSVQSKHESLADLLRMTLVPREYLSQSPFSPQQQPHQCPLGLLAKHRWMCKEAILESVRFVRGR